MEIGTKLLKKRNELRLSQQEVAHRIGISQSTYSMWESGKQNPALAYLDKVADTLNIPIKELIPEGTIVKIMDNQHQKNDNGSIVGSEIKMDAKELYGKLLNTFEKNQQLLEKRCNELEYQVEALKNENDTLKGRFG